MNEEKKNKKLLSPTGEKVLEYVTRKAVGGHIPASEFGEWEKYKKRCDRAGVSISCEGFLDMLKTHNKINDVMYPIANSYGYSPLKFKNEIVEVLLQIVKELDNKRLVKEASQLHEDIIDKTSEKLSIELKERINKKVVR